MCRHFLFCKFPKLRNDDCFKLIEPDPSHPLDQYNCWAYALGKIDAIWAYNAAWPQDVTRRPDFPDHIDSYIEMLVYFGYARCSPLLGVRPEHFDPEEGVEKVALYATEKTANGVTYLWCPHVSKQLSSGRWSSKNNIFDIFEHAPESLESEPGSAVHKTHPDECKQSQPDGSILIHTPMNFGHIALVMSRPAMTHRA